MLSSTNKVPLLYLSLSLLLNFKAYLSIDNFLVLQCLRFTDCRKDWHVNEIAETNSMKLIYSTRIFCSTNNSLPCRQSKRTGRTRDTELIHKVWWVWKVNLQEIKLLLFGVFDSIRNMNCNQARVSERDERLKNAMDTWVYQYRNANWVTIQQNHPLNTVVLAANTL